MKAILFALLVGLLMVGCGENSNSSDPTNSSKSLTESEVLEIKQELGSLITNVQKGDWSGLREKTHEAAYNLTGGRENFEAAYIEAISEGRKLLEEVDGKFLEVELGTPTRIYPAGKYELCFVPKIQIMEIKGQKVKATGFMIAARTVVEKDWKYLDGEILREEPKVLRVLFPDIDPDIELPTNRIEKL